MTGHRQYTALEWVLHEIRDTLDESEQALSRYVADIRDITQLRFCQTLIHQVYGSLHMVGFHGAAMLAEEMEILAGAMLEGEVLPGSEPARILQRAIGQLPGYLDRVQQSKRDYPGVVVGLLNEMRAARKASLVTEATLFTPNLNSLRRQTGQLNPVLNDEARLQPMAIKLRQMFQYAVASLVNDVDTEKNADYLLKVSLRLEKLLHGSPRYAVWQIASAYFTGLKLKQIGVDAASRQVFSGLDFEIGLLARFGRRALQQPTAESLLKNLLYYIGAVDSQDRKILSVKKLYDLDRFMPKAFVEQSEERFVDLDGAAVGQITRALEQEFELINSAIDHCLQGDNNVSQSALMLTALNRISDTLALLGIGKLREKTGDIANDIYSLRQAETPASSTALLEIKQKLAYAADGLHKAFDTGLAVSDNHLSLSADAEERLNESRNLLERSKDGIVDYLVSDWNVASVERVPENLGRVRDTLNQLQLHSAANIVSGAIVFVRNQLIHEQKTPRWQQLDSLADVISSVDYYIEYLSIDGENDETILDKAVSALSVLGVAPARVTAFPESDEEHPATAPVPAEVDILPDSDGSDTEEPDDGPDEEVLDIFCEEAEEIQQSLAELTPGWASGQNEALVEIRRCFHTLKGSGRMVGAGDIGELAWAMENMLNRLLDNSIPADPVQQQLVDKVRTILPDMVSAFRSGEDNPFHHLSQQCTTLGHQLSRSEQASVLIEELFPAAPDNKQYGSDDSEEEDAGVDIQLWDIFVSEARTHLEVVNGYIHHTENIKPLFEPPSDVLQRALHTVKGSAYMAGFNRLAELVAPLEKFAKELRNFQVAIDEDIFQLIKDCGSYTKAALLDIEARRQPLIPKQEQFLARTHELRERTLGHLIHKQQEEAKKVDPAMLEMLMTSEMDLLLDADMMIEQWQQRQADAADWQPVLDELLVLQQAAHKANLAAMASLCGDLAGCYQALIDGRIDANADHYALILDGHDGLMDFCDAMAAGQDLPGSNLALQRRLRDLMASQLQTPETSLPSSGPADSIEAEAASVAQEEDEEDIDEDAIEIFYEEAQELLEEIDTELQDWESSGDAQAHNIAIQRALHTFKGGARMARLTRLGDLAHDFESWLIRQSQGGDSSGLAGQAQQYQDQLLALTDKVAVKYGLAAAPAANATPAAGEIDTAVVSDNVSGQQSDDKSTASKADAEDTAAKVVQFPQNAPVSPAAAPVTESVTPGGAVTARKNLPQETVKVSAELMESLVNLAGETSINRGRVEEQVSHLGYSLDEMTSTVQRLQEQLRRLDIETEAQVLFRQEQMGDNSDFDPLEMDRYSQMQQLSRSLIESASDLVDLRGTLADKTRDVESVLLEQSRINTELQEGLMRSRMVPFSRIVPRLRRIVRQIATELGKDVQLQPGNTEGELDKSMMEKMVAPLEHMLRNAIDHGIEAAALRREAGKPERGTITINLDRDGGDVLIRVGDDGAGIDIARVREKAIERQLMSPEAELTDEEILQFILYAGFSTAEEVTQISGRGVGMDVVHSEIKELGGTILIDSHWGKGTSFTIRVPFTVSVNRALMVAMGDDLYAVPLNTIEGIVRVSRYELEHYYDNPDDDFGYAGQNYDLRYLGSLIDPDQRPRFTEGQSEHLPVLLLRSSQHSVAVHVDSLQGSREIVVKSLGSQFKSVQGVSGAAILGDGNVVVILDPNALVRHLYASEVPRLPREGGLSPAAVGRTPLIMVVDDSVTVRKVTSRLLEREGYEVVLAKDGVDAMSRLQEVTPDVMLLDIEMPRMDGFEVARNVRSSIKHQHLPIIMITSRTSDKHRQRGLESGANLYMGKPYQEVRLLQSISEFLATPGQD